MNEDGVLYAPLREEHLDTCAAIAAQAPDPWSRQDLAAEIAAGRPGWVAVKDGEVVAFACFATQEETALLSMVAVHPASRCKGLGKALLHYSLAQLQAQGIRRCVLEVRCGNMAALALYKSLGFISLARRPRLYTHPAEDGQTLEIILGPK